MELEKLTELLNLISNSQGPTQRSEEWRMARQLVVGASEIATIFGKNKYQKKHELARDKVYGTEFTGNRATDWGTIFEDVVEKITSSIFGEIFHTGSIPGITIDGRLMQTASPDGIGIVSRDTLLRNINNGLLKYEGPELTEDFYRVLYEFKAPLMRQPNGEIPDNYIYQIETGMHTCNCDIAIFVDCLIRRCSRDDLDFIVSYDADYNEMFRGLKDINDVKYIGFVGIFDNDYKPRDMEYSQDLFDRFQERRRNELLSVDDALISFSAEWKDKYNEPFNEDMFRFIYNNLNDDNKLFQLIDYGDVAPDILEETIRAAVTGKYGIYHSTPRAHDFSYNMSGDIKEFIDMCINNKYNPIGIIPYKILDVKYIMHPRSLDFGSRLENAVVDFTKLVDTIRAYNLDEDAIKELFGYKERVKREPKKTVARSTNQDDELDALFATY